MNTKENWVTQRHRQRDQNIVSKSTRKKAVNILMVSLVGSCIFMLITYLLGLKLGQLFTLSYSLNIILNCNSLLGVNFNINPSGFLVELD